MQCMRKDISIVHRTQKVERKIQPNDKKEKVSESPVGSHQRCPRQSVREVHPHLKQDEVTKNLPREVFCYLQSGKNPGVTSFKTFGPAHSRWCAQYLLCLHLVGLPGIEPGSHAPHACILPLYYSPLNSFQLYTTVHKTKTSDKCRGFLALQLS